MASVYQRNKKLYISWYDFKTGKVKSKSLKLDANGKNIKKANVLKAEFETALEAERKKFQQIGIERKTIERAFHHFLENNSSKRPKTINDYNRFFNLFKQTFLPDAPCTIITKLAVEKWLNSIKQLKHKKKDQPLKPNTIFGFYKQLHHFLNFLFEYNYIPMFMINKDVKPKRAFTEKVIFKKDDLVKILDGLQNKSSGFRAAIYILYYTGLRPSDILSFKRENIDLQNKVIKYYALKRKMHREIAFHPALLDILKERIDSDDEHIIPYAITEHIGKAFKRYITQLKLNNKKYTQYTFRKTFYTFARASGIRDEIVRELVGHTQDSVGNIHYNTITLDDMHSELQLYPTLEAIRTEIKK